ncbi:hypothetical protein, partial [Dubosiella newyorkensis]|uniref:hypothetical protein n=1 Tax=Dubosiella newyorkensis TaxID=1862672 RepID=UPI00272AA8BB
MNKYGIVPCLIDLFCLEIVYKKIIDKYMEQNYHIDMNSVPYKDHKGTKKKKEEKERYGNIKNRFTSHSICWWQRKHRFSYALRD